MAYINNSLYLARKYAWIFVRGHYLFREANSFPRAKLEENCELWGTDNVQGQILKHIFAAKLRLLCLLSIGFKNWWISSDIPQFKLGNIRPPDAFRPIVGKRKYLMDYNDRYIVDKAFTLQHNDRWFTDIDVILLFLFTIWIMFSHIILLYY